MRSKFLLSLSILAASALSGAAQAQTPIADFSSPSSLLVFPEFRGGPGHQTFFTVTNTNSSTAVKVHFVYVSAPTCQEFDLPHDLSANDTLTVSASIDDGNLLQGYLFVYAEDLMGRAISFNWLTGSSIQFDANPAGQVRFLTFASRPYGYKALAPDGQHTVATDDSFRDLNGIEYAASPDNLLFPLFFGQDPTNSIVSDLVLVNLTGGLIGPAAYSVHVNFIAYDSAEHQFSADTSFTCWIRFHLGSLTQGGAFSVGSLQTTSNTTTSINGFPGTLETGWFRIHADLENPLFGGGGPIANPAIIGVLDQQIGGLSETDTPYFKGTNTTGSLFSIPGP